MTPLLRLVVISIGAIAITALVGGGWLAARSVSTRDALAEWQATLSQAQSIRNQLTRLPVSDAGAPQPDRIATLARQLLVTAGVAQEALAGIQPLGDSALPGGAWHRQQVLLQLRGLTSQQAAAVIASVPRTDATWAVGAIQLNHSGTGDNYDAGLSLTTLYPARQ